MKHWKLLLLISFIVLGTIACGNATSNAGTVVTPQATTAAPQTYKIGQTVAIGGWNVKVNSIKTWGGNDFSTPKSGNTFLEISVSLQNTGTDTQTLSSLLSFKLADSTGQSYSETIVTNAPNPPDGKVSPSGKTKGTLVYEVPKTEKHFTFSFAPSLTTTDQAEWGLSVS